MDLAFGDGGGAREWQGISSDGQRWRGISNGQMKLIRKRFVFKAEER